MKSNLKIVLKIVVVIIIVVNLPFQQIYSESIQSVVSALVGTQTGSSNGKSIYIYNTHQGEKYATNSVIEGSQYLMQLLKQRGYEVNYETTDFELYKVNNSISYDKSYTVSKKYLSAAVSENGQFDLCIDFHRDSIAKNLSTNTYDGKSYAKFLFVVGKGSTNYEKANQISETLSDLLNGKIPGISRGVMLKQSDYNQGVADNTILIEVGATENTYEEVQNSLNILSLVIDEYLSS